MVERMKKLGIVPGQPFDTGKLDADSAKGLAEGAKSALAAIVASASGTTGDIRNGWLINWDLGRYGTNYGLRAVIAFVGLGANAPEDAALPAHAVRRRRTRSQRREQVRAALRQGQDAARGGVLVADDVQRQAALRGQPDRPLRNRRPRQATRER